VEPLEPPKKAMQCIKNLDFSKCCLCCLKKRSEGHAYANLSTHFLTNLAHGDELFAVIECLISPEWYCRVAFDFS